MNNHALSLLQAAYTGYPTGRPDNDIHVSDLANFCSRRYILCLTHKRPYHPKRHITLAEGVTYDLGRKIQDIVVARLGSRGRILGRWQCSRCGSIHVGYCPDICSNTRNCQHTKFRYNEINFDFELHGVRFTGNPDIFIEYPAEKYVYSIENKSIRPEDFDVLTVPQPSHVQQEKGYLWVLTELKRQGNTLINEFNVNTTEGVIMYVCKTQKVQPFKSFKVELDAEYIAKMDKILKDLKTFAKRKTYLPKAICDSPACKLARRCPEINLCMGEK